MTLCNMAIEAGARAGMVAVDETTINYIKGRPFAPQDELWDQAVTYWKTLRSDPDAEFDRTVLLDATNIKPQVTWEHRLKWSRRLMVVFLILRM